jgi:hypothetical protein
MGPVAGFNLGQTSVEGVHEQIGLYAAQLANDAVPRYPALAKYAPSGRATIFEYVTERIGGGLGLTLVSGYEQLPPADLNVLRKIGVAAIHKALIDRKDLFVGLVIGEARQGRNYFDRYDPANRQV